MPRMGARSKGVGKVGQARDKSIPVCHGARLDAVRVQDRLVGGQNRCSGRGLQVHRAHQHALPEHVAIKRSGNCVGGWQCHPCFHTVDSCSTRLSDASS